MMIPLKTLSILTITAGIFLCSHTLMAAQSPAPSAAAPTPVSVGEDSGTWRREPFIGSLKKGDGTPAAKAVQIKSSVGASKQELDIHLQGIMQADKKFHALINGRTVKAGDMIGGGIVKQITRYQVVLLTENKEQIVYDIYQGRIERGKQ